MSSLSRRSPVPGGYAMRGRRFVPGLLLTAWHGVWAQGTGLISQFNYC